MYKLFLIIFYILIISKDYEFVHIRSRRQAAKECESYEWQCLNKNCIDSNEVCDGIANCADSSDEQLNICGRFRCPSYSFRCAYGACVKGTAACDGIVDCVDRSDEFNCEKQCEPYEFKCNATQCIDAADVCDGKHDCDNKSDESDCSGKKCPAYAFRCTYGACINGKNKCDGKIDCADESDESSRFCETSITGDCIVPDIVYGRAMTPDGSRILPKGTSVIKYGEINITCWSSYAIQGDNVLTCFDGVWDRNPPQCIKRDYCEITKFVSTRVTCRRNDRTIPCEGPLQPNTFASIKCADGYEKTSVRSDIIRCDETGEWDYAQFRCEGICGKIDSNAPFVAGGESVDIREVPWQAAIYSRNKETNKFTHICGGTIINPRFVLSAAHCFWDVVTKAPHPIDLYNVAVGKTRRDYYEIETADPQFFNLSSLEVHPDFKHQLTFFTNDIAYLILKKSIIYQYNIKPVCLEEQKEGLDIAPDIDQVGIVAGWGMTEKINVYTPVLKKLELNIITNHRCRNALDSAFHSYITSDKFCAGHADQRASVCLGDSGGGLVIRKEVRNGDFRHYLIGIVSSGYLPYNTCQNVSYTTYTLIQKYLYDIKKIEADNRQDKF